MVIEKTVRVCRHTGKVLAVSTKQTDRSPDDYLNSLVDCVSAAIKNKEVKL